MSTRSALNVLSVASEYAPFVRTSGLADVVAALPGAVAPHGISLRTLIPGYASVLNSLDDATPLAELADLFGGPARLLGARFNGAGLYVIDAPHLYARPGDPYHDATGRAWPDNAQRFAALSWCAAEIAAGADPGWAPQVLQGHNWQAGFLADHLAAKQLPHRPGTILTIHTARDQGLCDAALGPALRLDPARFAKDGYAHWGKISALKAGIMACDRITTVSPAHSRELQTPDIGGDLHGAFRFRKADLTGILNGIDADWDPAHDPAITPYSTPAGKAPNKAAVMAELGLEPAPGPLCVAVGRITREKGFDLLLDALPELLEHGGQLALMGQGDAALEDAFRQAARSPQVAVRFGPDPALERRLLAGGDCVVVPSRIEPCGLTQLHAMRYGALPIVSMTGGLWDSVIPATPAALSAGVATGFQAAPISGDGLRHALREAAALYQSPDLWARMQANAMAHDVSWGPSARRYAALYQSLAPC